MSGLYGNKILSRYYTDNIDINISAETICRISEHCLNMYSSTNESSTNNIILVDSINKLKKFLKDTGNTSKEDYVEKNIKNASDKIVSDIKMNGINKNSIQSICSYIQDAIDNITNYLYISQESDDYTNAFTLLLWTICINTIINTVLTLLFGAIGNKVLVVIIGPLIEEMVKHIAIKNGFEKQFILLFNSYEMLLYTVSAGPIMGFWKVIKARLKTATMHLATTFVQWFMSNKKIQEAIGINDNNKDVSSTVGLTIGVIIHSIWNYLSISSTKFLKLMDVL